MWLICNQVIVVLAYNLNENVTNTLSKISCRELMYTSFTNIYFLYKYMKYLYLLDKVNTCIGNITIILKKSIPSHSS